MTNVCMYLHIHSICQGIALPICTSTIVSRLTAQQGQNRIATYKLQVSIAVPFTISSIHGAQEYVPELVETLGDALLILHRRLRSLTAHRAGRLQVFFEDATTLTV